VHIQIKVPEVNHESASMAIAGLKSLLLAVRLTGPILSLSEMPVWSKTCSSGQDGHKIFVSGRVLISRQICQEFRNRVELTLA
jgi:hypothetical protein